MKKAVVTGGAGFIGSNLSKELLDQDWQVNICLLYTSDAADE